MRRRFPEQNLGVLHSPERGGRKRNGRSKVAESIQYEKWSLDVEKERPAGEKTGKSCNRIRAPQASPISRIGKENWGKIFFQH